MNPVPNFNPVNAVMQGIMVTITRNPVLYRKYKDVLVNLPTIITQEFPLWNTWIGLLDYSSNGTSNLTTEVLQNNVTLKVENPIVRIQLQHVFESAENKDIPELTDEQIDSYIRRMVEYGMGYVAVTHSEEFRRDILNALDSNPSSIPDLLKRSTTFQQQLVQAKGAAFSDVSSTFQTHTSGRIVMPTGVRALDQVLQGGFRAGVATLFMLVSGHGKTTISQSQIIQAVRYGMHLEEEYPGLPLFRMLAIQTEMPLPTFVREIVAGIIGIHPDTVHVYSAVQDIMNPLNGPINLENSVLYLKSMRPDMAEMNLEEIRSYVQQTPVIDPVYSTQIELIKDSVRRHVVFADEIRGSAHATHIFESAIKVEGVQIINFDHLNGLQTEDIGRTPTHQFYSEVLYKMIRTCVTNAVAFLFFAQLNGNSSDSLSGKKKKEGPLEAAVSRDIVRHARVAFAGYRDPDIPNVTTLMTTKAPGIASLPIISMVYNEQFREFSDV